MESKDGDYFQEDVVFAMNVGFPPVDGAALIRQMSAVRKPQPMRKSAFPNPAGLVEPPPEVQAEVRAAARAAERLRERGLELRFETGLNGRLARIDLREVGGGVVRSVSVAEVLEIASGKEVS